MTIFFVFDILGTFAFAISGTQTAAGKKFDLLGATIIGFVTAIGGGTIRDVLLGAHPVGWLQDVRYLYAILLGVLCTIIFKNQVRKWKRTLFLFDTVGIGVFTVLGLSKALTFGIDPIFAVILGAISAVFGGVVRDTLCNDVPLLFRSTDLYGSVCLAGGLVYVGLDALGLSTNTVYVATTVFIIVFRLLSIKFHWKLKELD